VSRHFNRQHEQKAHIASQEDQEVLVVVAAQTVVNEWTVVVEEFNAAVADLAVEGCLGFEDLVVNTNVVQMKTLLEKRVHKVQEVESSCQTAGV